VRHTVQIVSDIHLFPRSKCKKPR